MNIFQKLFARNKKAKTTPSFVRDYTSTTSSTTQLYDDTAFACVDKIASAFSGLSFGIYDVKTRKKIDHPLYEVLREPNLDETHSLFFYGMIQDYFAGNVYLFKSYSEGEVVSLFRLNPSSVVVTRNEYNQKVYTYNGKRYDSRDILHIPSRYGYNGLIGKSIFSQCARTFNTANNLGLYTANTFDQSLGKRLLIDISQSFPDATDEQLDKIRNKYINNYSGTENAGKPIVKTGKIEFSTIDSGVSDNRSAQLSENRKFQQEVISQLFNVPYKYLIGDATDLEAVTSMFMAQAIKPIVKMFEESLAKLFNKYEQGRYYIEFNYSSILQTSLSTKIDAYVKQFNNGQISINEIRKMENREPIADGDYNYRQANLLPIREDIESSLVASAKLKQQEVDGVNSEAKNVGSDKL